MSNEIAKILVESGAVLFNTGEPFTYVSGIKSPIYTDCRLLISRPDERKIVSRALQDLILKSEFPDVICGTASAGIPWAAWTAQSLDKPMIYVRKHAKAHGRKKQVEGVLGDDARVVVVEDMVSTGKSALETVEVVRENGGVVTDVCCIFHYGFESAEKNFGKADVRLHSATVLDDLLQYCEGTSVLTGSQVKIVKEWKSSPEDWR